MVTKRAAVHAGSWYSNDPTDLAQSLTTWLDAAHAARDVASIASPRVIIGPHAGLHYSGPTAAYAYDRVDVSKIERVFLLGPSHRLGIREIALPATEAYDTPFGPIDLDMEVIQSLKAQTGLSFYQLDEEEEEEEHSLEMHLPFLHHLFSRREKPVKLVPLMVGHVSPAHCTRYGQHLAPYLDDESNLIVISSDFCHYGTRFDFTLEPAPNQAIWQAIEALDKEGMAVITDELSMEKWFAYLRKTGNTVCGRIPIAILLATIAASQFSWQIHFVRYDQSSKCIHQRDSSVSYASAIGGPL